MARSLWSRAPRATKRTSAPCSPPKDPVFRKSPAFEPAEHRFFRKIARGGTVTWVAPSLDGPGHIIRSMPGATIAVLHGDQTGVELLGEALRLLDSVVLGIKVETRDFDLSLEER